MLLRCILSELMKCRRNPVWLAFMILPLFPAVLGTFNYLGNIEGAAKRLVQPLDAAHAVFRVLLPSGAAIRFLRVAVAAGAHGSQLEPLHDGARGYRVPVPCEALSSRRGVRAGAGVHRRAFLLGGTLAGLEGPFRSFELAGWALGGLAVCAVQLLLSLIIRSFAVPVGMGLLGGVGDADHGEGLGLQLPIRASAAGHEGQRPGAPAVAAAVCAVLRGVHRAFAAAAICVLRRRDVTAD